MKFLYAYFQSFLDWLWLWWYERRHKATPQLSAQDFTYHKFVEPVQRALLIRLYRYLTGHTPADPRMFGIHGATPDDPVDHFIWGKVLPVSPSLLSSLRDLGLMNVAHSIAPALQELLEKAPTEKKYNLRDPVEMEALIEVFYEDHLKKAAVEVAELVAVQNVEAKRYCVPLVSREDLLPSYLLTTFRPDPPLPPQDTPGGPERHARIRAIRPLTLRK